MKASIILVAIFALLLNPGSCDFSSNAATKNTKFDEPSINPLCPSDEDPKNPTVLPFPNDCSKFYKCLHGKAYPVSCPQGLHYSVKLQRCDWPEVAECDPTIPTTKPPEGTTPSGTTLPPVSTTPGPDSPKKDSRCPENEDPRNPTVLPYPDDCSKFYKCLNGIAYPVLCPQGLHFSVKLQRCDWPEVAECDPTIPTTKAPEGTTPPGTVLPPVSTTPGPDSPKKDPRCPEDEDPKTPTVLPYPGDCSKFYKCLKGMAYPVSCPMGLHWSVSLNRCDWPEVAKCDPNTKVPSNEQDAQVLMNEEAAATTMPTTSVTPPIHPNCPEVHNPEKEVFLPHPDDCSKFYKCVNRRAYPSTCPSGLHFSPKLGRCDWPQIAGCDPSISTITPPPTTPTPKTTTPSVPLKCPPNDDPDKEVFLPYPGDCSKFYKCLNGQAYPDACPAGLHFSPTLKRCDWPESAKCDPNTKAPSNEQDTRVPMNEEAAATTVPTTSVTPPIHPNCPEVHNPEKEVFLPHPDDCSKFYKCVNRRAYPSTCPSGLHFSPKLGRCDWPQIAGCDPSIPTITPPPTTPTPKTTTPSVPLKCPPNDEPDKEVFLPYPGDCSKFYKCLNGQAYPDACPAGLHFSPTLKRCDWPESAKCDPNTKAPSNEQDTRVPMNEEAAATTVPTTSVTPPIHPNCPEVHNPEKEVFLPHPDDCSKFYKCVNRRAYPSTCPSGLHFSPKLGRCDWPQIAGCDPSIPTITPPPTTPTPKTTTPSVPLKCPPNDDPDKEVFLPYPGDCSKFYKCLNGQAYPDACPAGLHFSPTLKRCDWPESAKCDPNTKVPSTEQDARASMNEEAAATTVPTTSVTPPIHPNCPEVHNPEKEVFLPHPDDCSKFYKCVNRRAYPSACPSGLHFSPKLGRCDWPQIAGCDPSIPTITPPPTTPTTPTPKPTTPSVPVKCPPNDDPEKEVFLPYPGDCSKFYQCLNERAYLIECPAGLHFSPILKRCDWPEVAKCDPKAPQPAFDQSQDTKATPSTQLPRDKLILPGILPKDNKLCKSGTNQLIAHDSDCTKYIQCTGSVAVEKTCPVGTHFNAKFMICDYPERARCQIDPSKKQPETVAVDIPSVTRTPVEVTTVTNNDINLQNICEEAADNSYLQHPQDCSKYVHCYNKQMFIQQCAPGLLWNHQSNFCDYEEKVDCNN